MKIINWRCWVSTQGTDMQIEVHVLALLACHQHLLIFNDYKYHQHWTTRWAGRFNSANLHIFWWHKLQDSLIFSAVPGVLIHLLNTPARCQKKLVPLYILNNVWRLNTLVNIWMMATKCAVDCRSDALISFWLILQEGQGRQFVQHDLEPSTIQQKAMLRFWSSSQSSHLRLCRCTVSTAYSVRCLPCVLLQLLSYQDMSGRKSLVQLQESWHECWHGISETQDCRWSGVNTPVFAEWTE